jgi:hypothetical protein
VKSHCCWASGGVGAVKEAVELVSVAVLVGLVGSRDVTRIGCYAREFLEGGFTLAIKFKTKEENW